MPLVHGYCYRGGSTGIKRQRRYWQRRRSRIIRPIFFKLRFCQRSRRKVLHVSQHSRMVHTPGVALVTKLDEPFVDVRRNKSFGRNSFALEKQRVELRVWLGRYELKGQVGTLFQARARNVLQLLTTDRRAESPSCEAFYRTGVECIFQPIVDGVSG